MKIDYKIIAYRAHCSLRCPIREQAIMKEAKQSIKNGIAEYKRMFGREYRHFVESQMPETRNKQSDEWGQFVKDDGSVMDKDSSSRALLEMPENCDLLIRSKLKDDEERKWYSSQQCKRWIGRKYPEFLLSKDV